MSDFYSRRLTRRMALLNGGLLATIAGSGLAPAASAARASQVQATPQAGDDPNIAMAHRHGGDNARAKRGRGYPQCGAARQRPTIPINHYWRQPIVDDC